jgi:hypothetical protein
MSRPGTGSLWGHGTLLFLLLVALLPLIGPFGSISVDEGAAAHQARILASGDGWSTAPPIASLPDGDLVFPIDNSERTDDGWAPFARHPLYALALTAALWVIGPGGMVLLSMLGTVLAAVAAGRLMASFSTHSMSIVAVWAVGLGSPLLFDAFLLIAHSIAAAALGWAVVHLLVGGAGSEKPIHRTHLLGGAFLLVIAVMLRTEVVMAGGALSAILTVRAIRLRARSEAVLAILTAASVTAGVVLEYVWRSSIVLRTPPVTGPGGRLAQSASWWSDRLDAVTTTVLSSGPSSGAAALTLGVLTLLLGAQLLRIASADWLARAAVATLVVGAALVGTFAFQPSVQRVPGLLMATPLVAVALIFAPGLRGLARVPAVLGPGAREHNLKNINLDLPRDRLIVFTGLSGSGKSSLAFDTIYAEGQRRYVESLSAYARQFLGQMDKPDVDFIEGLSPAISIDQKSASRNPRSTVGTITEVYDYLRLLYARIGVPHCPECGAEVTRQTPSADRGPDPRAAGGHPLPGAGPGGAGPQGHLRDAAGRPGRPGLRPGPGRRRGPRAHRQAGPGPLRAAHHRGGRRPAGGAGGHRAAPHRQPRDRPAPGRRRGRGPAGGPGRRGAAGAGDLTFSQHLACPNGHGSFEELAPRNFSFNSPYGACEACDGLGTRFEVDPELVVPNPDLSLAEGRPGAVGVGARPVLQAAGGGGGRGDRGRPRRALVDAVEEAPAPAAARRRRGPGAGPVQEPLRPGPDLQRQLRGRHPVPAAPPPGVRVRLPARADRGLHAPGALPRLRRGPAAAAVAGGDHRRAHHRRDRRHVHRRGGQGPRGPRALRAGPAHRRAGGQGDQRPHGLPARRGPRLPDPVPLGGHPGRG